MNRTIKRVLSALVIIISITAVIIIAFSNPEMKNAWKALMGHAVGLQSLESLEEQQRLKRACASGVAEHGCLDVFCGAKQKVWIFFVDVAEHLFQFRTVNHFACELTS